MYNHWVLVTQNVNVNAFILSSAYAQFISRVSRCRQWCYAFWVVYVLLSLVCRMSVWICSWVMSFCLAELIDPRSSALWFLSSVLVFFGQICQIPSLHAANANAIFRIVVVEAVNSAHLQEQHNCDHESLCDLACYYYDSLMLLFIIYYYYYPYWASFNGLRFRLRVRLTSSGPMVFGSSFSFFLFLVRSVFFFDFFFFLQSTFVVLHCFESFSGFFSSVFSSSPNKKYHHCTQGTKRCLKRESINSRRVSPDFCCLIFRYFQTVFSFFSNGFFFLVSFFV